MSHPALDKVRWTFVPPNCERAKYRGVNLIVRHFSDINFRSVGYANGKYVGSRPNMPEICELLFAEVDRRKSR